MNNYGRCTETELVELTLDGDNGAFGELVTRTKQQVWLAITGVVSDMAASEDIAQDTYLDAFVQLGRLRDRSRFVPWVYGIAKRKALNYVTRRRYHCDIDVLSDAVSCGDSFEDEFIRKESAQAVRSAVMKLSPKNREVTGLYYFGGLNVADIASRLGLSEGTVKSRLYEARIKLKGELAYMNEHNKNALSPDFEAKVNEKIRRFVTYYLEHGKSDEYLRIYSEIENYINANSESTSRQSALASLYSARLWNGEYQNTELKNRAYEAAKDGNNAEVLCSMFLEDIIADRNHKKWIEKLNGEYIPKIQELGFDHGVGRLTFWRGYAWGELKDFDAAYADFKRAMELCSPDDVHYALAYCAVRSCELMEEYANDRLEGLEATAESWLRVRSDTGDKLLYKSQPGFGGQSVMYEKHRMDAFTYYNSRFSDNVIYDTSYEVGKTMTDSEGHTFTLIALDDTADTPAGHFDNCMHIRYTEPNYTADVWYAFGIGLVKSEFGGQWAHNGHEVYELVSYSLNDADGNAIPMGDSYFPLETGNKWRYDNPELPSYLFRHYENEVTYTDGELVNISTIGLVSFKKGYLDGTAELDSSLYISLAEKSAYDWKLDEAADYLRSAVKANTSQTAALAALEGIDYLERNADYHRKGYRFCPGSYNMSIFDVKDGCVIYDESGEYSFGPYRFGSRGQENRIFGVKPFRYLQELCGCVWNDKWTAGYSETLIHEDTPVTLEITDAGTVTTELGTFENCLKLTLNAELANQTNPNYYFDGGYRNVWCGRKEFIFAPGVGIVRFDFKWGNALDSSAVLVRYANPVRDKSYLPMSLGCEWEYDEVNLTAEGYRAKRIIKAACGMDGRYFAHDIQEFVYLGMEDEYEQFKRIIKAACGMDRRFFAHDIQEFVYLGTEDEYEQFKRRISGK